MSGIAAAYATRLALVSSSPGADVQVGHLPQELALRFNDQILDAQVMLTGPDGSTVPLGAAVVRNETAKMTVAVPDGPPGSYTVSYTAAASTRVGNGSFSFTVTGGVRGTAKVTPTPARTASPEAPATSAAAAPADFVSSNPPPPGASSAAPPAPDEPAWWTSAAVLLVVACVLVVFLGFSRRRIRPGNTAESG